MGIDGAETKNKNLLRKNKVRDFYGDVKRVNEPKKARPFSEHQPMPANKDIPPIGSKNKIFRINGEFICTQCGYQGFKKTITKGSFFIELILWLFFLIPGVIYSIWRLSSRIKVCPQCHGHMIRTDSPVGSKMIKI